MSAYSLKQFIELPNNELKKLKIGYLVRNSLPEILANEFISNLEVEKLCSFDYSKMQFDLNYPVLKKVNPKESLLQNRTVHDYTRYYAFITKYQGNDYLICSEWYDRNLDFYIKWLKRKIVI